jgi:pyrrolidone-carboxylate peptidase
LTLSEFIAGLQRFTQIAGDLPVVFKDAETEAETVLHAVGINVDLGSGAAAGSVTVSHGKTAAQVAPNPDPTQPDTATTAQAGQAG